MRRGILRVVGVVVWAVLLSSAAAAQSARTPPAAEGMIEGLVVHGHWRIVVRNPDGSVASRHEFNNALVDETVPLRALMGGPSNTFTGPQLLIGPLTQAELVADQAHRICGSAADPRHCRIALAGHTAPYRLDPAIAPSIVTGVLEATRLSGIKMQLVGAVTAVRDGVISQVGVLMEINGVATAMNHRNLTVEENGELPSGPIVVSGGQTVEFTVVVSFE
jgi:hypothetical protein